VGAAAGAATGAGVSVLLQATTLNANNAANNNDFFMCNIPLINSIDISPHLRGVGLICKSKLIIANKNETYKSFP
jgi:hypothetical protein